MNKSRNNLLIAMQLCSILVLVALVATPAHAQTRATGNDNSNDASRYVARTPRLKLAFAPKGFMLMPESARANMGGTQSNVTPMGPLPDSQVLGSGTVGKLTKWVEFARNNKAYIGDSSISEDTSGHVGVGTNPSAFAKLLVFAAVSGNDGIYVFGGASTTNGLGGAGVSGLGGFGFGSAPSAGNAGPGVIGAGGIGVTHAGGGTGVLGYGGAGSTDLIGGGAGAGVAGFGAATSPQSSEFTYQGGTGVFGMGGATAGVGNRGGPGLVGLGGQGSNGGMTGYAALLLGDVLLEGNLQLQGNLNTTGTKNFKIDHPLDPENKYLVHAAIESSEVLNIYSGNAVTNNNGEATVTLPEWFEAVNSDFRYQLTVIGSFAQAIITGEVKDHRFAIKTNAPQVKVSWQVTGVRSDPGMLKHPFKVEEDKPERERGTYLVPETYNQPEERGTEWARNPKLMQEMKEMRSKPTEDLKPKAQRDNR